MKQRNIKRKELKEFLIILYDPYIYFIIKVDPNSVKSLISVNKLVYIGEFSKESDKDLYFYYNKMFMNGVEINNE